MTATKPYRIMISGGGTGGHIFPAIAIAEAFRNRQPDAEVLFVGAKGKMEMTKVPEAGYKIVGLWISGWQRRLTKDNLLFPAKVLVSFAKAWALLRKHKPHAVVGTGGYASGPLLMAATRMGIPSLIQEQNSHAGLTNRKLAKSVTRVCVAYEGMEKYFPAEKIVVTGNPVRKDLGVIHDKRREALKHFELGETGRTLLVIGGSLGARSLNEGMLAGLDSMIRENIQVIWQTGKAYFESVRAQVKDKDLRNIRILEFLKAMDLAYAAADVVVSRAGALAISELCLAAKPAILVPSPNVVEDHQTKNAEALLRKEAARLLPDREVKSRLVAEALRLLQDTNQCASLSRNISKLARPDAADAIARELESIIR
jgi:UDP-N-acetylglucosamine--N-acetylmuramyl-(pentapeptide) pyrophosphoryl-undecaprenol N-acetylglucosamine transferase